MTGHRFSVKELIDQLKDQRTQDSAVIILGNWYGPRAAGAITDLIALFERLPETAAALRSNILMTVSLIGPAAAIVAVPWLVQLMQHAESRIGAILALRSMGPAAFRALDELLSALLDANSVIRTFAAQALGAIGPAATEAVPILDKASLSDPDRQVRVIAKAAIGKIQSA
jgi:hypothetical protein